MKTIITMRADLAEDGLSVPASRTFEDYDTQVDVVYITAQELEGATYGDDPADPDDHPFCYVELKDGRIIREREAMNRGSVDRPLTAQDIITKYRDNAARQVSAARSLEIEERVLSLEKGSARDLATCLGRIA